MIKTWKYLLVLIWISYLLSSGIYLFSKGFLLSRVSQTSINSCYRFSDIKCRKEVGCQDFEISSEILRNVNASADVCLPKKSKVVLIVIDALRYDFGVYDPENTKPLPYQNKLPIIYDTLKSQPERSRLLKFIADPPTTTLQRLKGLTTGSLPTFIDVGSNFNTPEINEDNIIDQIVKNNLSTVFMGDNTWVELFPKRFKREYGYPSFDIYDLDTVDNNLKKTLPEELKRDDWDVLIAHFLGVDHCGHKYGPVHSEMTRKLNEMNIVLENTIEEMDNETVLIVIGDHGMTSNGDHGGETKDEINALYFMYSKGRDLFSNDYNFNGNSIQQIDLVPVLASILGIPIPFSNLGTVQYALLPDVEISGFNRHEIALLHGWQNAIQMYKYFVMYARTNDGTFKVENIDEFEHRFHALSQRANTIYTEIGFKNFAKDLNFFLKEILGKCQEVWVNFDANLMSKGLLVVFLTVFTFFLVVNNLKVVQFDKIFTNQFLAMIYLISIGCHPILFLFKSMLYITIDFNDTLFYSCAYGFANMLLVAIKNWEDISDNWNNHGSFHNKFPRLVFITALIIFFSNSFVVEEQKILNYLLIGLVLMSFYNLLFEKNSKDRKRWRIKLGIISIVSVVLIRYAYNLFKCREEQGGCDLSSDALPISSRRKVKRYESIFDLIPIVTMAFFTSMTKIYMKNAGNLSGFSPNVMFFRYAPTVVTICTAGHFLLAQNSTIGVRPIHLDGLAWVVYGFTAAQILIIFVKPLMLFVIPPTNPCPTVKVYNHENVVPELFQQMKNKSTLNEPTANESNEIPVVYGLATAYSSVLIGLAVMVSILLALLVGPAAAFGIFLSICVGLVILLICGMLKGSPTNDIESFLQPHLITLVSYMILIYHTFYATSHQPTLSQINWHAAFVGRSSKFGDNNFISGILIILSTFNGQILYLLVYPILVIAPFIVNLLMPRHHQKDQSKMETVDIGDNNSLDLSRGELNLYEADELFIGAIFKTGCQLIMLQGARTFFSMLACTIHCRHLMVWKIFAPRFIFEGISTFVSLFCIILSYVIIIRVHKAIDNLIINLRKKNR